MTATAPAVRQQPEQSSGSSPRARADRRVSARVAGIGESATLAVDARAKALKAAGHPVIGFGAGEPDFATPPEIVEAAIAAARDPRNHRYTPVAGLPELRAAIAAKTLRDSGYRVQPEQVLVTNGGKQAVYQAFATLLDPGDERFRRRRAGVPGQCRATGRRRQPAHQGAVVRLTVQSHRGRLRPGRGR